MENNISTQPKFLYLFLIFVWVWTYSSCRENSPSNRPLEISVILFPYRTLKRKKTLIYIRWQTEIILIQESTTYTSIPCVKPQFSAHKRFLFFDLQTIFLQSHCHVKAVRENKVKNIKNCNFPKSIKKRINEFKKNFLP